MNISQFGAAVCAILCGIGLTACGGGGGDDGGGTSAPFISAELDSFPTGSVPTGFNRGASVTVLDDSTGTNITTASVVMNGVTLTYDVTNEEYQGNVVAAPGGAVTLNVTVGGTTYTASATQFVSYPTVSAPASGATWDSSIAHAVTWSGGAPAANASYGLGVLDAADPNSVIWPLDHFFQEVPIGTTSFSIPSFSVTAGNRLVVVGIATSGVAIPNAASGSSLIVGGLNFVPITVPGMPVTSRKSGTTNTLSGVAWSGTQFAIVGQNGTTLLSPDGKTWTARTLGIPHRLSGVVWSGTKFLAAGTNASLLTGVILTSPDGTTWTDQNVINAFGTTWFLGGVVWSGTQFVAVGGTRNLFPFAIILTSPDGTTWTPAPMSTPHNLSGVAWSGTQFVAVGGSGTGVILTSPDGTTWTSRASGTTNNLSGVVWSGTQFVAVGNGGTIVTSPDGITWTTRTSGTTNNLFGVTWSGTQFVAVGGSGNTGTIVTSSDGVTWTQQASGTANTLSGVVWSGAQLVMVGANGTILTSP